MKKLLLGQQLSDCCHCRHVRARLTIYHRNPCPSIHRTAILVDPILEQPFSKLLVVSNLTIRSRRDTASASHPEAEVSALLSWLTR